MGASGPKIDAREENNSICLRQGEDPIPLFGTIVIDRDVDIGLLLRDIS